MTKFFPAHYTSVESVDATMAVLLVYFNPTGSVRQQQNILLTKFMLDAARIPVYIAELAVNDEPFLFATGSLAGSQVVQTRSTSLLFFREGLVRLGVDILPPEITKVCVLDAEVLFCSPDWYSIMSRSLDTADVVQPFTRTRFLGPNYRDLKVRTNSVSSAPIQWSKEHTGHVWAFRRAALVALLDAGLDHCVVGGGDIVTCAAVAKRGAPWKHPTCDLYAPILARTQALPVLRVGACDLEIVHLFHGTVADRQYEERHTEFARVLVELGVASVDDAVIRRPEDGLVEWRPDLRSRLNDFMRRYFERRQDDRVNGPVLSVRRLPASLVYAPLTLSRPSMMVILAYFNPVRNVRSIQNLLLVRHLLTLSGIPFRIAEIAFGTEPYLFNTSDAIQFRSTSYLFYKENLVSLVEERLEPQWTRICMLDGDVVFERGDWYAAVDAALDIVDVVQPFSTAVWLNADFTVFRTRGNAVDSDASKPIDWRTEHPGFAWAFRRSWYRTSVFRTVPIAVSCGDTIFHDLLRGRRSAHADSYFPEEYALATATASASVTYTSLPGTLYHLNHGLQERRRYANINDELLKLVQEYGYATMSAAVAPRQHDGLLEWRPKIRKAVNAFILDYLESRQEDEVV